MDMRQTAYPHGTSVNLDIVVCLCGFGSTSGVRKDDGGDSIAASVFVVAHQNLFDLSNSG